MSRLAWRSLLGALAWLAIGATIYLSTGCKPGHHCAGYDAKELGGRCNWIVTD